MSLDNEVLDTLSKNPQTPTACRVETKQSPTPFEMVMFYIITVGLFYITFSIQFFLSTLWLSLFNLTLS